MRRINVSSEQVSVAAARAGDAAAHPVWEQASVILVSPTITCRPTSPRSRRSASAEWPISWLCVLPPSGWPVWLLRMVKKHSPQGGGDHTECAARSWHLGTNENA